MKACKTTSTKPSSVIKKAQWRDPWINLLHSCIWETAFVQGGGSQPGRRGLSVTLRGHWAMSGDSFWLSQQGGPLRAGTHCTEPGDTAWPLTMQGAGLKRNSPAQDANRAKAEKLWSTPSLLLQTYHLIHGVTGVVVFWVGASNPHRLKKFFLLLFIFVRQRLLWFFVLDWGIILLFARTLVVTPPVFFLLPTSSLLLPTWRAASKGGEGG